MRGHFDAIPPCPEPGHGVHHWTLRAAWALLRAGYTADEAIEEIQKLITRSPRWREIEDAVGKAYSTVIERGVKRPQPIRSAYDPEKLKRIASKLPDFSERDLKECSALDPESLTAAEYLHALYRPGEKVLVFDEYQSQGQLLWHRPSDDRPFDEDALEHFQKPAPGKGAWFGINPVDGDYLEIDRLRSASNPTGSSRRAEENLTDYRYFLFESDDAPQDLWLRAIVQLPLPIVSICTSGGRSLHSLVRVNGKDGDHWRKIINRIAPKLSTLGACKGTRSPAQLSRLPGCFRAEKNKWQELLYINSSADETPIRCS